MGVVDKKPKVHFYFSVNDREVVVELVWVVVKDFIQNSIILNVGIVNTVAVNKNAKNLNDRKIVISIICIVPVGNVVDVNKIINPIKQNALNGEVNNRAEVVVLDDISDLVRVIVRRVLVNMERDELVFIIVFPRVFNFSRENV